MFNRNLSILLLSQIFSFTAAPITVFLSGIIGSSMIDTKSLATLPIALSVVGTSLGSIFASYLMSVKGRKFGFMSATLITSFSALIASFSILNNLFILYCLCNFLIGIGLAFTAQYRFAAAESVAKDFIPKAISYILFASMIGALLGPNIATLTKDYISSNLYVGSYVFLSLLTILPFFFLIFYKNEMTISENVKKNKFEGRDYYALLTQPRFAQAIVGAGIGYACMAFLMNAFPISMHLIDNMSIGKTGFVIQMHLFGMFLPSLFTGNLVKRYGHSKIMYAGVFVLLTCIACNFINQSFYNYLFGLMLLGVGWNFLFIAGTSLLIISYKDEEKFKAQGLNDFFVFSTQSVGAILAGLLLNLYGWQLINLLCIPFLFIIIIFVFIADTKNNIKLKI